MHSALGWRNFRIIRQWINLPHIGFKALLAGRNTKWFDQLTTLSEVEGQISNSNV